jgi:hypothetical protein
MLRAPRNYGRARADVGLMDGAGYESLIDHGLNRSPVLTQLRAARMTQPRPTPSRRPLREAQRDGTFCNPNPLHQLDQSHRSPA